jgi:hypothetical protein
MLKVIHDATTGQILKREMNAEELAQWQADKAADGSEQQPKPQPTEAARQALLDKLGITEDEAKLLLS